MPLAKDIFEDLDIKEEHKTAVDDDFKALNMISAKLVNWTSEIQKEILEQNLHKSHTDHE